MDLLQNTPLWVYLLLAYLVWQGLQSLRPRTQPVWRRLIVPLVFIALGLSRIVQGNGGGTLPLLAWLARLWPSPPVPGCSRSIAARGW